MSEEIEKQKEVVRVAFRSIRRGITQERRLEAKESIKNALLDRLASYSKVLSYSSFSDEIELHELNRALSEMGKLFLPRVHQGEIQGYMVGDLSKQLILGEHNFMQPDPNLCPLEREFDCILVPAIAFDREHNRIGYGKGHYDRFLQPRKDHNTIGVGFREQLSQATLPCNKLDQPMRALCLV